MTNIDNLRGVVDVLPAELRDVDETVNAAEVDERTEVHDRRNDTLAHLALLELVEEVRAGLRLGLLEQRTTRKHHVVAVLVELENLRFDLLVEVGSEVTDATQLDQRSGEEATQTDVNDEATLDHLDDSTGNDTVLFLDLLDVTPGALVLCALLREEQTTFLVFLLDDQGLDLVTEFDNVVGVDIVLDREFALRDNTLSLVTNVEEHLVAVDANDGTRDQVAVVEILHSLFDRGEEIVRSPNVVNCDLLVRLIGRGIRHVGRAPEDG